MTSTSSGGVCIHPFSLTLVLTNAHGRRYACPINNSGYTNTVASLALTAAVDFAAVVGDTVPEEWAGMAKSIAAATAPVPKCTPPSATCPALSGEYHPEYDGYPHVKSARVKQADVVMLGYPLGVPMDSTTLQNDLEWCVYHGLENVFFSPFILYYPLQCLS